MGAAGVRRTRAAGSGIILMAARRYLANRYVLTAPSPHRLPTWVGDTLLTWYFMASRATSDVAMTLTY
jgi:hypothetical protein